MKSNTHNVTWRKMTAQLLAAIFLLVSSCGAPPNPKPGPNTDAGKPGWNPPQLGADCPIGPHGVQDFDQDGACDAFEEANGTSPTNPNSDGEDSLDGLNMSAGNGGGGNKSPWYWALYYGLANILWYAYVDFNNDCTTNGITVKCLEVKPGTTKIEFKQVTNYTGLVTIEAEATINQGWFLLFNWDFWLQPLEGKVISQFKYDLEATPPSLVPTALVGHGGDTSIKILYMPKSSDPSSPDPDQPVAAQVKLYAEANGCDGKGFRQPNGTGIIFKHEDPSNDDICFESLEADTLINGAPLTIADTKFNGFFKTAVGDDFNKDNLTLADFPGSPKFLLLPRELKRKPGAYVGNNPLQGIWEPAP